MRNVTQHNHIIRLSSSGRTRAAELLAQAFQNDPMYVCAIPDDDKRAGDLLWLFERVVHYCLLYGEAYITPALEGVACWLPPGRTELTIWRMIRVGLPGIVFRFGWVAYRRLDDNLSFAGRLHKQCAATPHWYLWAIGVEPTCQGKGIGGALIQPVLTMASAVGVSCYLETHNERNVSFYRKHGFEVVGEGVVPKHNLRVWAMLRRP